MLNVKFPETPYVECIYGLRTNSVKTRCYEYEERYDEYDRVVNKSRLKRYVYKLPDELVATLKSETMCACIVPTATTCAKSLR